MQLSLLSIIPRVLTLLTLLTATPAPAADVEILVELIGIQCGNTEDVTGADEFYVLSAFTGGTIANSNSALMRPISINDGQEKTIPAVDAVMIHARFPATGKLAGRMRACDEDYAKTWETMRESVEKATKVIKASAAAAGSDEDVEFAESLEAAFTVYDGLASLDEDDVLGTEEVIIHAAGPAEEVRSWRMVEEGLGFSTWDYTVTFRITRIR